MLLWTWTRRHLLKLAFSFPLGIFPKVELPDHWVVRFLIFWGSSILFVTGLTHLHSYQRCRRILFLVFLVMSILTGHEVTGSCGFISLRTSDVDRHFMSVLAFAVSSSETCLLRSFAYLLTFFLLSCVSSSWIWRLTPHQICSLQILFPSLSCLLTLLMVYFAVQKLLVRYGPTCSFPVVLLVLSMSKKSSPRPMSRNFFSGFLLEVSWLQVLHLSL